MTDATEVATLTADVVLFSVDERGGLHVLLIERRWEPFMAAYALPGGHVDPNEDTEDAGRRELAEETGISVETLSFVGAYAAPGRDPRGRYATFAYVADVDGLPPLLVGDDAADARWIPVEDAFSRHTLAFDHAAILADAYQMRRSGSY